MFENLLSGTFVLMCGVIATTSWVGGAYSIYRGIQHLPDGALDVPFFASDPDRITEEGRRWRARVYTCMFWFTCAVAMAAVVRYAR